MRVWELGADFTTQIKLLIRSFICSFFLLLALILHTHPLWSHQLLQNTRHDSCFLGAVSQMLHSCSTLDQSFLIPHAFLLISFYKIRFLLLPHSAPQILTLGSKLTWALSAIFRPSTSLRMLEHGTQETSPQYTVKVRPGTPYLNEKVWKWPKKKRRGKDGIAEHLSGLLRPTGWHTGV